MTDDEYDQFKKEVADVAPIPQDKNNTLQRPKKPTDSQLARQIAATTEPKQNNNTLSTEYVEMVDPHDIIHYKRDGVQDGVYRKLRLGKYSTDAVLDLHRKKVEQARQEVFEFIHDCQQMDLRTVMILHGKGVLSKPPALLKSYVNKWLPELDGVLAFHSAQNHHGGTGALYVLLRKSEKKKRENKDRHMRRNPE